MNVKQRAEAVATFRHVNVTLMESLARWVPSTPEMEVKVLFGRHIWVLAQLADQLGRRTRELRAPLHHNLAPAEGFATALQALDALRATAARIEGFHGPALAALQQAYREYLSRTDALIDEPTALILEGGLRDIERMRMEKARLLDQLPTLRGAPADGLEEVTRRFAASGSMIRGSAERQSA